MDIFRTKNDLSVSGRSKTCCRLLYLVGGLGSGGLEKQLYHLLKAMDRERNKSKVVVWNYKENEGYGFQIRKFGIQFFSISNAYSPIGKLLAFHRMVRNLRPKVIHSYRLAGSTVVINNELGIGT